MSISQTIKNLKFSYQNGPDNIGRDFVQPCLKECTLYRRGTGFFSSSALLSYAGALDNLLHGNSKVQIICSPVVQDNSVLKVLEKNVSQEQREKTLTDLSDKLVLIALGYQLNPENRDFRSKILAYLIAKEILEIRFAIPKNFENIDANELQTKNLYHVKKGYFLFDDQSTVAFNGSFNESDSGHQHHIDETQVYKSWIEEDRARLNHLKESIDADWNGSNPYLNTLKLSSSVLEIARQLSPSSRPRREPTKDDPRIQSVQKDSPLREYQEAALNAWKENEYRGILAMATGTGKTRTALEAIVRFRAKAKNGLVFITVPTRALAVQWKDENRKLGISTVSVFDSQDNWVEPLTNFVLLHLNDQVETKNSPVFVCVNKSFESTQFQRLVAPLNDKKGNRLLVVDECHHFNKVSRLKRLPELFNYRIGLSATPYESDEPKFLERYFGKIVYEYSLGQAIKNGNLVAYKYRPVLIEMTDAEAKEYLRISNSLAKSFRTKHEESEDAANEEVLLDSVLDGLIAKFYALEELLKKQTPAPFTLFYSGGGSINLFDDEKIKRLDSLGRLLTGMGWKVSKITCEESERERSDIVQQFKNKIVDAIVSIRILDEGIDIPDCRTAYILASQRSERQGIQRRGRILRISDGKDFAELYDFIVVGPLSNEKVLRDLYSKELKRARMFAEDALNRDECLKLLATM